MPKTGQQFLMPSTSHLRSSDHKQAKLSVYLITQSEAFPFEIAVFK